MNFQHSAGSSQVNDQSHSRGAIGWAGSDIRRLVRSLRSQWLLITGCTFTAALLGFVVIVNKPATYTARGTVLVENTKLFEGSRQELLPISAPVESSVVDTQVEIIKSEGIVLKAIERLNLTNASFPQGIKDLKSTITELLGNTKITEFLGSIKSAEVVDSVSPQRALLPAFLQNLMVRRVKLTAVIEVGFRSDHPDLAAKITNQVINTYLSEQSAANAAATAGASAWLRDRIKDIGERSRVISFAGPPLHKDGPRKFLLLASYSALGALFGLGLAVFRSLKDTRLREPAEASGIVQAPYLGSVRHVRRPRKFEPRGKIAADCYQVFRTAAAFASFGNSQFKLRIGSVLPHEGLSAITLGIALAAAASGRRVLILDACADGRSGVFDEELARVKAAALTICENSIIDYRPISLSRSVTAPDPQESEELDQSYNLVLVQLPPMITNPDAFAVKGSIGNKLMLVINWNEVPAEILESCIALCAILPSSMLGFIFNNVPPRYITRTAFPVESYLWKRYRTRASHAGLR